jgi:hypothetical protein
MTIAWFHVVRSGRKKMTSESPDNVTRLSTQRARDHQDLLSLAVQRVRLGTLPTDQTAKLFAGPGRNACCSLCEDVIALTDIEYEVDCANLGASAEPVYFHRVCYFAWLQACE